MEHVTLIHYLEVLDKCLKQLGVKDFLAKIGFDQRRFQDPGAFITLDEFGLILQKAYQLSHCEHLGLVFGEYLSLVNHGFLGYAVMTSPTWGAALDILFTFLNTRTSLLHGYLKKTASEKVVIELHVFTDDPFIERFITEMTLMHLIKLRQFLINTKSPCLSLEIAYHKPAYAGFYQQMLSAPMRFNAPVTKIWLLASELDHAIHFADEESNREAKSQLQTAARPLLKLHALPLRIEEILLNQERMTLTMEEVAKILHLSTRTLRRHLQDYQLTYQQLLDKVREEKARKLLANSQISMTEISFLLGFHDSSNFSKAFKRWTQMSPSDYRLKDHHR